MSETEDNGVVNNPGGTEDDQVINNPDNESDEVMDSQDENDEVVENQEYEDDDSVDNRDEADDEAVESPVEEDDEVVDNPDEENDEVVDNRDEADDEAAENPDEAAHDVLYNPGDIILELEEPFAKILSQVWKGTRCDHCFKESSSLLPCPKCKIMHYCDRTCQRSDWNFAHVAECKSAYFRLPGTTPAPGGTLVFMRQMSRLHAIFQVEAKSKRTRKSTTVYDEVVRTSDDLVSHQNEVAQDKKYVKNILTMARLVPTQLGNSGKDKKELELRLPSLYRIAGIWKVNGVAIVSENHQSTIGYGLYLGCSSFDHSCRPSATINFKGICCEVRAIAPIRRGERPTVSYLSEISPQNTRAFALFCRYHFTCYCSLCTEELTLKGDTQRYKAIESLKDYRANEVTWEVYFDVRRQEINLLRELYAEYDERISDKFLNFLVLMVELGAPADVLEELANETEEHVKITFGEECGHMETVHGIRQRKGLK